MTEIICLANSRKLNERCVAGIDLSTGKWVRPIFDGKDGAIPYALLDLDGSPVRPLDIIDVPLSEQTGGYELENRLVLKGQWRKTGRKDILDILPFCEHELIHDRFGWKRAIPYQDLLAIPLRERRTLQLVFSEDIKFLLKPGRNKLQWRAIFSLIDSEHLSITDDEIVAVLDRKEELPEAFLLTLSLSQPFKKDAYTPESCYRLVAAVFLLEEHHVLTIKTDRMLKHLQWTENQSRSFLEKHFRKRSRRHLTIDEFYLFEQLLINLI